MLDFKKILGGTLLTAAVVLPAYAGDFFCSPEEFIFRTPRRMPAPEMCRRAMPQNILVRECEKGFMIELVTPGVPKEAYDITLAGDVLKISICRKACPMAKCPEMKEGEAKCPPPAKPEVKPDKEKKPAPPEAKCPKTGKPCPKLAKLPGFEQAYKLPPNADKTKIKAAYKDGIMKICIPKVKVEPPPEKKIVIE